MKANNLLTAAMKSEVMNREAETPVLLCRILVTRR
jgi:hypothetical protein